MLSFLYGLLVAFSPCVLPLIPIILKMCQTWKGVLLYLAGSAVSYTILGIMLASVGVYFQSVMQSWPVLLSFSAILGYLALASFNVVRLPQFYFQTSNAFLMGVTAPIICSPCMTPALAGIITLMISKACWTCGIIDLALFGAGVSLPLVLASFGLNQVINKKILKYSEIITKLSGVLLIGLIIYLWM